MLVASPQCLLSLALALHWMLPQTSETVRLILKVKRSWCKSGHVNTTLENATNKWLAAMHIINIQKQKHETCEMHMPLALPNEAYHQKQNDSKFNMCEEKNKNLHMHTPNDVFGVMNAEP